MFGQGSAGTGTHDVTVGYDLSDDQWHQIDITQNENKVLVIIDITRKKLTASPGQLYQNITIASIKDGTPGNTPISSREPKNPSLPPISLTGSVFEGCMEDVTFNSINIFKITKEKSKNVRILGKLCPKCADDAEYFPPATLDKTSSYIRLDTINGQDINLKFEFRTFDHTGVLVHYNFGVSTASSLLLELINGKLKFIFAHQNLYINKIISSEHSSYADGLWHKIQLNITSNGVVIQVNNETSKTLFSSSGLKYLTQNQKLTIGSRERDKLSLIGCVRKIRLNDKYIQVTSNISESVTLDKCDLTDLCFINPCLNQGVCQKHNNKRQCDCTNTGYSGSRCQNISTFIHNSTSTIQNMYNNTATPRITISPKLKTTVVKTIPKSVEQDYTQSIVAQNKATITSTAKPSVRTTQLISSTTAQRNPIKTSTTGAILTDKLKSFVTKIATAKPDQSNAQKNKQTFVFPTRQSLPPMKTHIPQQTMLPSKKTTVDQLKKTTISPSVQTSTIQLKQSNTKIAREMLTDKISQFTATSNEQTTTPLKPTNNSHFPPSPSTMVEEKPILNLSTAMEISHPSVILSKEPSRKSSLPTGNPTQKMNTQVIIIEKPNTITKFGFNKNQLLVYLFLFIVFILFVGLVIIISVKMSYLNACSCVRRFQSVNSSLPSQDSIEMGHQQRKDSTISVRIKTSRPSSLNDSGIDRSESVSGSNRSSVEVQDGDISIRGELGTTLQDNREGLVTSPEEPSEGFLILQEDPPIYTQKTFGWTVLNSSNTVRHYRTSTKDLVHAANENKPRLFKPAYYQTSEISDDVRLDVEDDVSDDVVRYRNPTTRYRQLTPSDCSSLDNVSIDTEQYNQDREDSIGEECPVF